MSANSALPTLPPHQGNLALSDIEKDGFAKSASDDGSNRQEGGFVDEVRENVFAGFTWVQQRAVLKKVDLYILPILILAYLNKNLDVNNISNIKIIDAGKASNILKELKMTSDEYAWCSTIYTIPFAFLEIPSTLCFKRFGPKYFFFTICLLWSAVAAAHAGVTNKAGLYACRFLLGVFKCGLFPSIYAHFTYWYRPDEMALRVASVGLLGSFSGILSALIAFGIDHLEGGKISAWRVMFLVEGVSGFFICALIWFFLPNFPDTAPFLTPAERELVVARLPPSANVSTNKNFSKSEIVLALKEPTTYAFLGLQMFSNLGTYGLQWWLPTVIASFGFTTPQSSQLLNIPPAAVGIIVALTSAWFIDNRFTIPRPVYLLVSKAVCIAAFIGLTLVKSKPALYALIILATTGSSVLSSVLFGWRAQSFKGSTHAAFILAFQNGLSQLSGVISPQIFRSKFAPRYTVPYIVSIVFLVISFLSTIWAWYLTKDVERETRQVAAARYKAGKEGNTLSTVEIKARPGQE